MITQRSVIGMFFDMLSENIGARWLDAIATPPIESDQDSEDYAWMGMAPVMAEMRGEKKFSQLRETTWAVKNVLYQGGLVLPKNHILYDKTGQIEVRARDLAERTNSHWAKLIGPLLLNGATTVCYDGQYFYDTDHSEGDSGTQSNSISVTIASIPAALHGTTTAPSAAEFIHAVMKGIEKIISFKDDQGEYVNENLNSFMVTVPSGFLVQALTALTATSVDGGDSNLIIQQGDFKIEIQALARLSSWTNKFAVHATGGVQKPFIRQQRIPNNAAPGYSQQGLLLETLWLESEYCKLNNNCLVSVETERAAAYGDWKKSCLVTLA